MQKIVKFQAQKQIVKSHVIDIFTSEDKENISLCIFHYLTLYYMINCFIKEPRQFLSRHSCLPPGYKAVSGSCGQGLIMPQDKREGCDMSIVETLAPTWICYISS